MATMGVEVMMGNEEGKWDFGEEELRRNRDRGGGQTPRPGDIRFAASRPGTDVGGYGRFSHHQSR